MLKLTAGLFLFALYAWYRRRYPAVRLPVGDRTLAAGLALGFFVLYLALKFNRHHCLQTFGFDLSAFDYAYWNALHHGTFFTPFFGKSYLREHFFPILVLPLPIYALKPGPEILLVIQAAMVAAAAAPFYLLARRITGDSPSAVFLTCALMLNRYLLRGVTYDFHIEMLQPLLVALVFWCYGSGRFRLFAACFLLLLCTKENVWILGLVLSAVLFFHSRDRRYPAAVLVLSVCALAAIRIAVATGTLETFGRYLDRWKAFGETPWAIAAHLFSHPGEWFNTGMLKTAAAVLFPTAGLALLSPLALPVLPEFLMHTLSKYPNQADLQQYYGSTIATVLFVAAVYSFQRLLKHRRGDLLVQGSAILILVLNLGHVRFYEQQPWMAEAIRRASEIPEDGGVVAENSLIPHVSRQRWIRTPRHAEGVLQSADYLILGEYGQKYLAGKIGSSGRFRETGRAGPVIFYGRNP